MITNGYMTLAELKAVLRDTQTTYDALYERAIEAASREIDRYCGTQFWKVASPTVRIFKPSFYERNVLHTGDFANTTGLIVRTDEDDDGTFETTWSGTEYQVEPLTPIDGRPYNRIVSLGGREFPVPYYEYHRFRASTYERDYRPSQRARVQITANWGWELVPPQVRMACQILAIDNFKSKDLTGASAGVAELSTGQFGGLRFNGIKVGTRFNPLAEALLMGFRTPAFA